MTLGEKVKEARKQAGLSQEQLSEKLEILTDAPFGTIDVFNELKNADKQYYLVEQDDKQFLVLVTDEFIVNRELVQKQYSEKFEIGDMKFTKCTYEVK